jgi:hypothetical protein
MAGCIRASYGIFNFATLAVLFINKTALFVPREGRKNSFRTSNK